MIYTFGQNEINWSIIRNIEGRNIYTLVNLKIKGVVMKICNITKCKGKQYICTYHSSAGSKCTEKQLEIK
jgi:hypothetical protein